MLLLKIGCSPLCKNIAILKKESSQERACVYPWCWHGHTSGVANLSSSFPFPILPHSITRQAQVRSWFLKKFSSCTVEQTGHKQMRRKPENRSSCTSRSACTSLLLGRGYQQALRLAVGVSPGQGSPLILCYPQNILPANVGHTFYNTLD